MKIRARRVNNWDLYANHSWYVPGIKGMFALLGWFLLGNILGSIIVSIFGLFVPPQVLSQYSMLVLYPLSFMPAMVYVANKSQRNSLFEAGYKLNSSHFGPFKGWMIVLITVALTYATMIVADLPNYYNYQITSKVPALQKAYEVLMQIMEQMIGGPFWSSFLLAAIFAPVFEEWLCRGMVLRGLLSKMKPGWAIVISALFFALIHMNPWQALNAFIIGVVMGYVYYKSGSLLLTMLIHFVNNGTAVVLAHIESLKDYEYWIDILGHTWFYVAFAIALAIIAVCIAVVKKIPVEHPWGNIDQVESPE